jgi:gamma-glutamylcyclotransferase (GGCT)/AIG2-like uncharacterized protein YtfP
MWQTLLTLLLSSGAVGGALAFYRHVQTRRQALREQSLRTAGEYASRFYGFAEITAQNRIDLEYNFFDRFAPAMEKYLLPVTRYSDEDKARLAEIDRLLNFFESVSFLKASEFITQADRDAVFNFWLRTVFRYETHVVLRKYLEHGFEALSREVQLPAQPHYLAVYGTLCPTYTSRHGFDHLKDEALRRVLPGLKPAGTAWLRGKLYNLGAYPGLVHGFDRPWHVRAELLELPAGSEQVLIDLFRRLDAYEEVSYADPQKSLYARRFIPAFRGEARPEGSHSPREFHDKVVGAWVYTYRGEIPERSEVPTGDWLKPR